MFKKYLFFFFVLLTFSNSGLAQSNDSIPPPKRLSKKIRSSNIDSNLVSIYYSNNPEKETIFADTAIDGRFYQFDGTRTASPNEINLGNAGSATESIIFNLKPKYGTMSGFDHFDLYLKGTDDVKFYRARKAVTDLYYSQGNEQNDHIFKGTIARSFDDGMQLTVEHNRLIHSLEDDDLPLNTNAFYPFQKAKNTNLLVGISYYPKDKKYSGFLNFVNNEIEQKNHGGIKNDSTVFSIIDNADQLPDSYSVPVNLSSKNANTRYAIRSIKYQQYYKVVSSSDSNSIINRNFKLGHSIAYDWNSYKFSDESPEQEYYGSFYEDDRGIRNFLKTRNLENYLSLSIGSKNEKLNKQKAHLEIGLRHSSVKIEQEFADSTVQNLFGEGKYLANFSESLSLNLFGQLGLLENIGDYRIDGGLSLSLKKLGTLSASLIQQRYSPEVLYQSLYLSQNETWSNDYKKPFQSELRFKYDLPIFKFSAKISYFLMDNYLYFDKDIQPRQNSGAINVLQFVVAKNFKVGIFRMENTAAFQASTQDEIINLPSWWSKHSIAIQGKLFKKVLDTRFGFDFRFNDNYYANAYFPLLGQFHVQRDAEVKFYPAVDAQLSFKVESFRFFFKMDNLSALATKEVYYQIPFYPQKETSFRFGLGWKFLDKNNSKSTPKSNPSGNSSSGKQRKF